MSTLATSLISLVIWFLKSYVSDQKAWQIHIQRQIAEIKDELINTKDRMKDLELNIKVHQSQEIKKSTQINLDAHLETQKDVNSIVEFILAQTEAKQNPLTINKDLDNGRVIMLEKKVDAIINALTKRSQQKQS